MRDVQALEQKEAEVHQIALAPAAVARQFVDQVRRHLFVAAAKVVCDPYCPAGAAHQCGLDKIVRQDLPGQAAAAWQPAQRAVTHEWRDANNGVMSPVM